MNQGKFEALVIEIQRTNELLAAILAALTPPGSAPAAALTPKPKAKAKPSKAKAGDGVKVA